MAGPLGSENNSPTLDTGTLKVVDSPKPVPLGYELNQSGAALMVQRLEKPWKMSEKLLPFLGVWENGVANGKNWVNQIVTDGFILTVYNDSKNLPTVGCGHLVVAVDKLKVGDIISMQKAKELLQQDLEAMEKSVNRKVNVPLSPYEYDALVSITFNVGPGSGNELLAKFVNSGKYEMIPDFIKKYRAGGGHEKRRVSEAQMFKSGVYDASH